MSSGRNPLDGLEAAIDDPRTFVGVDRTAHASPSSRVSTVLAALDAGAITREQALRILDHPNVDEGWVAERSMTTSEPSPYALDACEVCSATFPVADRCEHPCWVVRGSVLANLRERATELQERGKRMRRVEFAPDVYEALLWELGPGSVRTQAVACIVPDPDAPMLGAYDGSMWQLDAHEGEHCTFAIIVEQSLAHTIAASERTDLARGSAFARITTVPSETMARAGYATVTGIDRNAGSLTFGDATVTLGGDLTQFSVGDSVSRTTSGFFIIGVDPAVSAPPKPKANMAVRRAPAPRNLSVKRKRWER